VVWRRKFIIVTIVAICRAYTYVQIKRMTPLYQSSTRIYISQNAPHILNELEGWRRKSITELFECAAN